MTSSLVSEGSCLPCLSHDGPRGWFHRVKPVGLVFVLTPGSAALLSLSHQMHAAFIAWLSADMAVTWGHGRTRRGPGAAGLACGSPLGL